MQEAGTGYFSRKSERGKSGERLQMLAGEPGSPLRVKCSWKIIRCRRLISALAVIGRPVGHLVTDHGDVVVQIEHGGRAGGIQLSCQHFRHGLVLGGTVGENDDLLGAQNGTDAHGQGLGGHVGLGGEETGVGLDGGFGQTRDVGSDLQSRIGLVEANVAVLTDTQHLYVSGANRSHDVLIGT